MRPVAAAGGDDLDARRPVVVPADVGDLAAVARPGRISFELARARVSRRGAPPAHVLDPQMAERFIDDAPPVGAGLGEADHLHVEAGRARLPSASARASSTKRVPVTWNGMSLTAPLATSMRWIPPPAQIDDRAVVGSPAHPRIDAVDRPGFLHVAVERVGQRRHRGREAMSSSIERRFVRGSRRMKAKLLPSGEGVGRIAPPGPVT